MKRPRNSSCTRQAVIGWVIFFPLDFLAGRHFFTGFMDARL